MTLATWITFFLACWAISLSPGPGAIASMSAGLNHPPSHRHPRHHPGMQWALLPLPQLQWVQLWARPGPARQLMRPL